MQRLQRCLDLNSDYDGEIDAVLRSYSSCSDTYKLPSVDKVAPPHETRENGYNYYVRHLGGNGAQPVDESFETYQGIDGFIIHHKVAPARECSRAITILSTPGSDSQPKNKSRFDVRRNS